MVGEHEGGMRDALEVHVIDRSGGRGDPAPSYAERDVAEAERGRACSAQVAGAGVFGGPEEPEEADDTEVCHMSVELAVFGVMEVENTGAFGVIKLVEDDGVDRVDSCCGPVLVLEGGEVSAE